MESGYVSAFCALFDDQHLEEKLVVPHPRGKATKALMTRLRIDWSAFKRASFEDRAIHGLTDGYTTEQAAQLSAMLLAGGKVLGEEGVAGGMWHLLRTRLDFLLMHSMMLRGEVNAEG